MKKISIVVTVVLLQIGLFITNLSASTIDWLSFRANQNIVSIQSPRDTQETVLDFAVDVTDGYDTITNPVIVGDYMYIATQTNSQLLKLDKSGNIVATAPLDTSIGYNGYITYGDGKIFVAQSQTNYDQNWNVSGTTSKIQAFDSSTLASLWISEELSSTAQETAQAPIIYHNGYIYCGTANASLTSGKYFALTTIDEDPTSSNEEKTITWEYGTDAYSWIGGCVVGDTIVFISNDGQLTACSLVDGSVKATRNFNHPVASSIVYDDGHLYVSTKNGRITKIDYNTTTYFGGQDTTTIVEMGSITGTPTIVNGRIYIGGSVDANDFYSKGFVAVIDAQTYQTIYYAEVEANVQSSLLVSTGYQGEVNAYFTQNAEPGGVYCLKDTGSTQSINPVYIPTDDQENYCATSVISDGARLYHTNDSGYIMALSKKEVTITPEQPKTEPVEKPREQGIVKTNKETTRQIVKTGDDTNVVLVTMILIFSGGIYVYIRK